MCLPTLPRFLGRFEKSTIWLGLKNSFLRFLVRSKTDSKMSENRYNKDQAGTHRHVESNDSIARFTDYNVLFS